ncbi:MAG: hypothetical protein NTY19_08340, partial [Planctomycetota bacterium]|nr:hypothetical protein [Planctomycetota bacterium]
MTGFGYGVNAMKCHPKLEDVSRVEQATYDLLLEIGLPFKRVLWYEWVDEVGTAAWKGESEDTGFIKLFLGCEAEAVAHEIGHGFHEALNHNSVAVLPFPVRWPEDGEAVGEALRYFVERRL